MLESAVYTSGKETLKVSVERVDVLLKDTQILNFPRLIELEGDKLVLAYGRGRHTGAESRTSAFSDDFGKTWRDAPPGSPWADNVQTSGILGYLRDGSITYVDVMPEGALTKDYEPVKHLTYYHNNVKMAVENPTFRRRRFSRQGTLIETGWTRLVNLPWKAATYENYGRLLELDNGDILTGFMATVPPFDIKLGDPVFRLVIARSSDGGKTFEYVHSFVPDRSRAGGAWNYDEHDLAKLANGDILCIMRTDGPARPGAPMYQSRSKDGGLTWSEPVCVGWPGAKPDLCLLSNGVLACSSGRGIYGHPQITHAMFSIDGTGEKWEYPFAFHTGPGCSYTSNLERNGKLYVAYSDSSFTQDPSVYNMPYQSIKWAVLNVTKEKVR